MNAKILAGLTCASAALLFGSSNASAQDPIADVFWGAATIVTAPIVAADEVIYGPGYAYAPGPAYAAPVAPAPTYVAPAAPAPGYAYEVDETVVGPGYAYAPVPGEDAVASGGALVRSNEGYAAVEIGESRRGLRGIGRAERSVATERRSVRTEERSSRVISRTTTNR
jgi:hypothetical protein